ncbi:TolC family protein [Lentisphaera profundi]|uniref:TolC family protein n=1 Tax=Lentisphaera profundi TaxID=1658616 RepID=A0ABY7VZZ9_9BACT|nr:TolC family protein [Lentisphaera profundi]WDE98304.1 TolC family protein [Lentisphaera profundi]
MKKYFVLISLTLLTQVCAEQLSLDKVSNLDLKLSDVRSLVIKNLSEIRNSEIRIQQTEATKDLRVSRFKTQGDISAGYENLFDSSDAYSFGFDEDEDERMNTSLKISQYLYGFGRKKWALEEGLAEVNLSRVQNAMIIRDLSFKARLNYWNYIFEQAGLEIANERLQLSQEEEQDTESLFEAGTLSRVDVLQTKVTKMQSLNTSRSQKSRLHESMIELASSIGLVNDTIKSSDALDPPQHMEKLLVQVKTLLDKSLEIALLEADSNVSQTKIEQVKSEYAPELYGLASAGVTGPHTDDLEDGWLVGVTLNWKILDGNQRNSRRLYQAKNILANQFSVKAEIRERTRIYLQLETQWDSLAEQIFNEKQALAFAEENYTIAREQYQAGLLTLLQVSDVNLQLVESRYRLLSIIYQMQVLRENLLYLKQ